MKSALPTELEKKLPGLLEALLPALARSADPEHAPRLAGELLAAVLREDGENLRKAWAERPKELLRIVSSLCGAAPFLAHWLAVHPSALARLAREDFGKRTREDYARLLEGFLKKNPSWEEAENVLRRFKYYEFARITVRDLSSDLVSEEASEEIFLELSALADVLLDAALRFAQEKLAREAGPPVWDTAQGKQPVSFCVLGLGKLGGGELNYSSDVDLLYIHESLAGEPHGGPGGLSPQEYFSRLANLFGRLVTEQTAEGFLHRIDLDLRPQGRSGPLVVSEEFLSTYYEAWAAAWERAAFAKARPVAGDGRLGWRAIRALDRAVYRSTMDLTGVAAIAEMKRKVESSRGEGAARDVKVGPGGIRDVEFVAQALQLLHGGRIPQVRTHGTQDALRALSEVGLLPKEGTRELLAAYRFLRRLENRLQMESERQTHFIPTEPSALRRLARSMGYLEQDGIERLEREFARHRETVRRFFGPLLGADGEERILELFLRAAPRFAASPATRASLEDLARHFAQEVDSSADPRRAFSNLARFVEGVGSRTFYYGLLLDRPELVPRLVNLFASSDYLSEYFAVHPRLIEPIFSDPQVLLLTRAQLEKSLRQIQKEFSPDETRGEVESALGALRLFRNRELINIGLLDLAGKVTLDEVESSLTDVAEVCVQAALELARKETRGKNVPPHWRFLVAGMGKLGSRELAYGSDLDVVFFYDGPSEEEELEAQEYFVRLAQKFIWALTARTGEGVCYEIDARLRPSGRQGMLVASLSSFRSYHGKFGAVWERQALLRARGVSGDKAFAEAFDHLRREILSRPLSKESAGEIRHVRERMEKELARERPGRYDFKTG
ncbi:MAG: hypothetical protein AB1405_17890, partial [Bdellovibrionota bacterium]